MTRTRISSVATLLGALIILISPAIHSLPAFGARDNLCDASPAGDHAPDPHILFPRWGVSMPDSEILLFHLPPVVGATEYEWQIERDGFRISQIDQRVPPPGFKRFLSELFGTWALAEEMSHAPSHQAMELIDELAGPDLEIIPAQLPDWHSPATLTVLVSARQCGSWRSIDSASVQVVAD